MPSKPNLEEKDLLESYENDEWVSVQTHTSSKKYQAAARETLKKDKSLKK